MEELDVCEIAGCWGHLEDLTGGRFVVEVLPVLVAEEQLKYAQDYGLRGSGIREQPGSVAYVTYCDSECTGRLSRLLYLQQRHHANSRSDDSFGGAHLQGSQLVGHRRTSTS